MKEYLNVDIENDKQGVLQDVHWSGGAIGYFPTYIIGQILACQIFNAAKRSIDGLDEKIKRGEFEELLAWTARQRSRARLRVRFRGRAHGQGDGKTSGRARVRRVLGGQVHENLRPVSDCERR